MTHPISEHPTIDELLRAAASNRPDKVYLRFHQAKITYGDLEREVSRVTRRLGAAGLKATDRVAVMLPNSLDAVFAFFALIRLGGIQIPVNINLKGESLRYLIEHSEPRHFIAHSQFKDSLAPFTKDLDCDRITWCDETHPLSSGGEPATVGEPSATGPHDVVSIMYTSGTTGAPKGVQVTDKMHRACAYSSGVVADVHPGDCFYLWEPLYHITGTEVLILALMQDMSIGLTSRFSASRFWVEVEAYQATHIHYVGGILQILLRQPVSDAERNNSVRIAWGGGAPSALWEPVSKRFRLSIRENYGMTETSSLTSFNTTGKHGSVGQPAPYFDVGVFHESGRQLAANNTGEIWVRDKGARLITPGYFRNPEATAKAFRDGWFRTGDVGYLDAEGFLYYAGRIKDSVRRRGENISGWEIERVVEQLPSVEECALIGVPDELGDEELKLFVKSAPGSRSDAREIFDWCEQKLARFQVPRFLCFCDGFEKTDTQRIKKELLSRDISGCWTRDRDGNLVPPETP